MPSVTIFTYQHKNSLKRLHHVKKNVAYFGNTYPCKLFFSSKKKNNKNKIWLKANKYKFEKPAEDSTINIQCRH